MSRSPVTPTGMALDALRYPVGPFRPVAHPAAAERAAWIAEIAQLPAALRDAVHGLTADQLDTPYRPGGWTVRQVVHHLPDSHMNSYIRFKLAMTENQPVIKPYDEARWAELFDAKGEDIATSLALLSALHARWVTFLRSLDSAALQRTFRHPELGLLTLDATLQLYAWHGRHHVAHVLELRKRMGW